MIADAAAYQLIHDGILALSQVEANGMAIDVDYLDRMLLRTKREITRLQMELRETDVAIAWRRRWGDKTNYGSRSQLAEVLFKQLGYQSDKQTASGQYSTNVDSLERLNVPAVQLFLRIEKLKKLHTTYLTGIRRETVDGFLHPSFSLHTTKTYRSSSQDPNFQNQPVRDPFSAKLIRRAFVPRPGRMLLEVDYSAIEVRIACCYHKDPTMQEYIETGHDMHKDMAMECFLLPANEVSKPIRHLAKNGFVFPEFYGDFYASIARSMWDTLNRSALTTTSGLQLVDWLRKQGIGRCGACEFGERPVEGTFEHHIQKVERRFWDQTFPRYKQWREWIWDRYKEHGWIKTKTGFVVQGEMRRNEVINFPVQGSAFHCLLWSLIYVQKWLTENNMHSLIVGQIHDSLLMDVEPSELSDVSGMVKEIMCHRIRKHWPWIITPLEVEAEGSYENWYAKKAIAI